MSKSIDYSQRIPGIWWFSDDPKNVVPGDLLVEDGELELNGSLDGIKPGAYGIGKPGLVSARQDRTILGVARNGGKKYTLEYFDEPSTTTMSMPGYKADTYTLGHIFEGDHFDRTDNLAFEEYYVELPYLLEWVNDGVISIQMILTNRKAPQPKDMSFNIDVGGAKSIEVFKGKTFNLSFRMHPEGMTLSNPVKDMHLSQRCVIKVESVGNDLAFGDAGTLVTHMGRFLAIATGQATEPVKFQAFSGSGQNSKAVSVLTRVASGKQWRDISVHAMNFSFSDIKADSQTIFEKWFEDMDKHADMFNLFSIIRSDLPKNVNNQFKDIVSALEGYVSVEQGKLDVSPDKAVKMLNENLPKTDRPISSTDYNKIRITRNKLSHVAIRPGDEAYVLNDSDKWINIQRMTFLLEYSLLKGLGLSEAMLAQFYEKRKLYL